MRHNLLILLVLIASPSFGQTPSHDWNLCYKNDQKLTDHFQYLRIDGTCAPNELCKCIKYVYSESVLTTKIYHGFRNTETDITLPIQDPEFLFRTFNEIFPNNLKGFHGLINLEQKENIVSQITPSGEIAPDTDIKTKMDWLEKTLRTKSQPKLQPITSEQKAKLLEEISKEAAKHPCNPALFQKFEDLVTNDQIFISAKDLDAPHHIFYYDRLGMFGERLVLAWPDLKHRGAGLNLWGTLRDLGISNFLISMNQAYVMMTLNTNPKYQTVINQVYPAIIHQILESKNFNKDLKKAFEDGVLKSYEKEVESASVTFIVDNIPCVAR